MTDSTLQPLLDELCEMYGSKELARLLKCSPVTVARWRTGKTTPAAYVSAALRELLKPGETPQTTHEFTFIDLFAGIGGIRMGFESAGGKCVFTSEWNVFSQKTYRENFPDTHKIVGDIVPWDETGIPDHDVLLAGFPCQPFSIAGVSKKNALGRPHGFECATQGTLFFNVQKIIAAKRPAAFLLENVKNLRSHDGGNTFRVIMDVLQNKLGYKVQWRIIDGAHFTPQHRERIIIVGFREETAFDIDRLKLPDIHSAPTLRSILHSEDGKEADRDEGRYLDKSGKIHSKYTLTENLWRYLQDYAEKHRLKGNGFGYGLVGPDDIARTLSARYYKDGSEILVRCGKTARPRRLTPRECARLMGFPDDFRIPVSDTQAYRQFGNSVVVPVIKAVARQMKPHLITLLNDVEMRKTQPSLMVA